MIYIFLLILSFFLTFFIKNYAIKKSLVATVNERSSHTTPIPHGGGIAIAITWFIGLVYLKLTSQIDEILFNTLLVGIIISFISLLDDIYELSANLRFIIQSVVTILTLYFLGGFNSLDLGFLVIENQFVTNIFAFFMIIWFINLYNFLDGINGYAGSEAVFLGLAGLLIFGGSHFIILTVAVLGFLFWNYNKAKIFMGDVGSTLLGFNIAIFTIYYSNQESSYFWIWITLFSLFWFDATYTLIRRKLNKERLFQAHKKHAYQRLTQAGWSHFKVTNYSIIVNIVIFLFVYFIPNIAVSFAFSLVLLNCVIKFIDGNKKFE